MRVDGKTGRMTPSQKLRAAIYSVWKSTRPKSNESFLPYYESRMRQLLAQIEKETT